MLQVVMQTPPDMPMPPPWMVLPPPVVFLIFLAIVAGATLVLWPLMRAIGRRIEGRGGDPELRREIEDLRARVAELESGQYRVGELEERLDFAERLLAQRRDQERLPGG